MRFGHSLFPIKFSFSLVEMVDQDVRYQIDADAGEHGRNEIYGKR